MGFQPSTVGARLVPTATFFKGPYIWTFELGRRAQHGGDESDPIIDPQRTRTPEKRWAPKTS